MGSLLKLMTGSEWLPAEEDAALSARAGALLEPTLALIMSAVLHFPTWKNLIGVDKFATWDCEHKMQTHGELKIPEIQNLQEFLQALWMPCCPRSGGTPFSWAPVSTHSQLWNKVVRNSSRLTTDYCISTRPYSLKSWPVGILPQTRDESALRKYNGSQASSTIALPPAETEREEGWAVRATTPCRAQVRQTRNAELLGARACPYSRHHWPPARLADCSTRRILLTSRYRFAGSRRRTAGRVAPRSRWLPRSAQPRTRQQWRTQAGPSCPAALRPACLWKSGRAGRERREEARGWVGRNGSNGCRRGLARGVDATTRTRRWGWGGRGGGRQGRTQSGVSSFLPLRIAMSAWARDFNNNKLWKSSPIASLRLGVASTGEGMRPHQPPCCLRPARASPFPPWKYRSNGLQPLASPWPPGWAWSAARSAWPTWRTIAHSESMAKVPLLQTGIPWTGRAGLA